MALELFPYQKDGGTYLGQTERAGLHDEMGVGKTGTTWDAIHKIGAERGIIVVPAHLRENWLVEKRKFFPHSQLRVCKGNNIHDYYAWAKGKYNIIVPSYEQATRWAPMIRDSGEVLDFVALEEAHYLKNGETLRARAILGPHADGLNGLIEWAQHVWHITGTPMANDPLDIYTFLRMCGVMPLSQEMFIRRYFHKIATTYGSRQIPRPEMIPELQTLIQNNSIRRTKKGIGLQLPPIFLTTAVLDGDTDFVRDMLAAHPGLEQAIINALEMGGLSFLDAPYVATLRRLIGEAKAIPYAHTLLEELRGGETDKRVVFGIHQDALAMVRDFLWKHNVYAVLVNGTTKAADDIISIREFQENPQCTVFIGNIRKAGTGNTLTAACEIDILESDWSPSGNAQAIMRVHRIGQARKVRARFMTLARSFDEVVNRIVADKTASIAAVDGEAMIAAPPIAPI